MPISVDASRRLQSASGCNVSAASFEPPKPAPFEPPEPSSYAAFSAECHESGAAGLLISGLAQLKHAHVVSLTMRFPDARRIKHGPGPDDFDELFIPTNEEGQLRALRLLRACGARTIPLAGEAAEPGCCLHVQCRAAVHIVGCGPLASDGPRACPDRLPLWTPQARFREQPAPRRNGRGRTG